MTSLTRLESDNLRRLEEMRATFEKLGPSASARRARSSA